MSTTNSKPKSKRTILKRRKGDYVVARDEGSVTRIYRLHVLTSNGLDNLVAEPDRGQDVTITSVAATTVMATTTCVAAMTDAAATIDIAEVTGRAADALERPDVTSAIPDYAWSMQLHPLKDPPE
jgi:hypothetical protein